MSPPLHLIAVACAVLLVGCESANPARDTPATAANDRTGEGRALTPTSVALTGVTPEPTPLRATVRVADQLRRFLDRLLGDPLQRSSLHRHIRQVSVGLHVAAIHTDLSSDELDRWRAERICLIASRFRQSPEGRHVTSLDIEVYGETGDLIASHDDLPALASTGRGSRGSGSRTTRQGPAQVRPVAGAPSPTPARPVLDRRRETS